MQKIRDGIEFEKTDEYSFVPIGDAYFVSVERAVELYNNELKSLILNHDLESEIDSTIFDSLVNVFKQKLTE